MPAARKEVLLPKVDAHSDPKSRDATESPQLEETDWNAIENAAFVPDSAPQNGDMRYDLGGGEAQSGLDEEDDDNPYQESDEALPDDEEEAAIRRDPGKLRKD